MALAFEQQPPLAPTSLTDVPGRTLVELSWLASSGATSYNVKRSTTKGGPYTTIKTGVTGTTYTDSASVVTDPDQYAVGYVVYVNGQMNPLYELTESDISELESKHPGSGDGLRNTRLICATRPI